MKITVLIVLALCAGSAGATGKPSSAPATATSKAEVGDVTGGSVGDVSTVVDVDTGSAAAGAEANNTGNNLSVTAESGPANLVLVPNNNTESCLRVFGFSGGNRQGSAMFGIPFRSSACDYDKAADAAAATGDHETAWFWRCHKKALYKPYRDGRGKEAREAAIAACHAAMVGPINAQRTIDALRERLAFIENERQVDRDKCEEAKDRIAEAWKDSSCGK